MRRDRGLSWGGACVPLLLAFIGAVEAVSSGFSQLRLVLLIELAACTLLIARRRWPLLVAPAAMLLLLGLSHVGPAADEVAAPILMLVLAAFTLARWLPDLRGLAVLVPIYLLALFAPERSDAQPSDITDVVFMAALVFPPYIFGLVMRTLADRNVRLEEQAESLARLQATVRQDAIAAERVRIARELHDVLAHSISAMVVQAAAGQDLVRSDPERAATAMRDVADTGRRALAETGRLLLLVRDTQGEMGLEPDLGLDRLDDLVEQFRRSGLEVTLHREGSVDRLPVGIGLSAYRIVQEALTNALKYSPDRSVRLRVSRGVNELTIEAENHGQPGPSAGSGLGLVGMVERVSVFGGNLEHGFTGDGRFRLSALLPLETADA